MQCNMIVTFGGH